MFSIKKDRSRDLVLSYFFLPKWTSISVTAINESGEIPSQGGVVFGVYIKANPRATDNARAFSVSRKSGVPVRKIDESGKTSWLASYSNG